MVKEFLWKIHTTKEEITYSNSKQMLKVIVIKKEVGFGLEMIEK